MVESFEYLVFCVRWLRGVERAKKVYANRLHAAGISPSEAARLANQAADNATRARRAYVRSMLIGLILAVLACGACCWGYGWFYRFGGG